MSVAAPDSASPGRTWATSTVWAGAAWIVLAVLPVPATTLLGPPLVAYALLGGVTAVRRGWQQAGEVAMRGDTWGVRLSCTGFIYLVLFYLVAGGLILAGLITALSAAQRGSP